MILRRFLSHITLAAAVLLSASCAKEIVEDPSIEESAVIVGFSIGNEATRSFVEDDGESVRWQEGDELALWAKKSNGSMALSGQPFTLYGHNEGRGWFTSTLSSAMSSGTYTYYAAYPKPEAINGTVATFTLPSTQNGRASGGEDIMISNPAQYGALEPLPSIEDHSGMSMSMNHLVHLFRFYLPYGSDPFPGESVQKMTITFPRKVVGSVKADVTSPSSASLENGSEEITLELESPLEVSSRSQKKYAYAAIFPTSFSSGENMEIKLFTESKVAVLTPVSLQSRTFAAGHATSVKLNPSSVSQRFKIYFNIATNNLGEDVEEVVLTAPEGCNWGNGSNVYTYSASSLLGKGDSFFIEMEDEAAFRGLSDATVEVRYESEHVSCNETVTMPRMMSGNSASLSLNIPWLMFEDFSGVNSFSSDDEYVFSSVGSKGAQEFLDGWSAARAGASAGQSIRLATRRETSVDYPARADSKPLFTIKKAVNVDVTFDYGADNKYGGVSIITDGNVGQDVYVGYVTSTEAYKSGDSTGTFLDENTFYIKEYTGSYTNLPHTTTMTLTDIPAGSENRITWRTVVEHQAGTTSTTVWLYLDNIKVKVASGN